MLTFAFAAPVLPSGPSLIRAEFAPGISKVIVTFDGPLTEDVVPTSSLNARWNNVAYESTAVDTSGDQAWFDVVAGGADIGSSVCSYNAAGLVLKGTTSYPVSPWTDEPLTLY